MRCFIFGSGEYSEPHDAPSAGDFIIAADGGYRLALKYGVKPDLFVGDLDSLEKLPENIEAVKLPTHKDDTDTGYAVSEGLKRGCTEFHLCGCMGGRPDHTEANYATAMSAAEKGGICFLYGADYTVTVIKNAKIVFDDCKKGTFSVFAYGGKAKGVTVCGAEYPLSNAVLTPDYPVGVSNAFADKNAEISVSDGRLLVMWETEKAGKIKILKENA